jgi:Pyrimidine operon attenuation protein/uracil phosphoribosyltransferase
MDMVSSKNCVLTKEVIDKKIKRMALQVAEQNIEEPELIIAGIAGNGEKVASCLIKDIKSISSLKIIELTISLDKKNPVEVKMDKALDLSGKVIILVDDVANTGRTLLFALKPFLNAQVKKIQTLVLVERSHKLFPIQTDYSGLSISTTLQEHIMVEEKEGLLTGAWLY